MSTSVNIGGSDVQFGRSVHFLKKVSPLLPFVFAFAEFFINGEAGLFCVGDRELLEVGGGAEAGDGFSYLSFSGRTFFERSGRERSA